MKRICVFCGSSMGNDPRYHAAAVAVGNALAENHIELVYGGGSVGLMGAIADTMLARGGNVTGVIPEHLAVNESCHTGLTTLHRVTTMHERKALMARLADAFIALPGGIGTLEELAEMLTWSVLNLHHKPVGLLNINRYYDHLLGHVTHMINEGFMNPRYGKLLTVHTEPDALVRHIMGHKDTR